MELKAVKIGDIVVPHGLFLAPMAGFTDLDFRRLCHECGAEFSVTEMISAKAVCFGDKKTWELARLDGDEDRTSLQIFGHDPDDIETACRRLIEEWDEHNVSDVPESQAPSRSWGGCADAAELSRRSKKGDCAESQAPSRSWDGCADAAELSRRSKKDSDSIETSRSWGGCADAAELSRRSKTGDCAESQAPSRSWGGCSNKAELSRRSKKDSDSIETSRSWDGCADAVELSRRSKKGDCAESQAPSRSWDGCADAAELSRRLKIFDVNMGCPVKKIVSSGDGSALMRDPELCRRIVEAAKRGSGGAAVTVKIRAGFDGDHKNAAEVARACADGGADAVFVHGRTREQFYAPSSDNGVIAAVREALPPRIPVIGNGDITTVEDAKRMLRETGCDGLMIGRAALGDPWLFARIAAAAEGRSLAEPTVGERLSMARRLCRMVCDRYGEERGVPMCRGRAGHFIRGIGGAAAMRDRLCHATTLSEVEKILTEE